MEETRCPDGKTGTDSGNLMCDQTKDEDDVRAALEKEVEEAITAIDSATRREYDRAREIVPELVKFESNVSTFLRCDNYDSQKAAKRIVMYWKLRKQVFGSRWMLPLTQTGTGALSMDDIQILRSGYLSALPLQPRGCVVLYDETRLPGHFPDANARIAFYLASVFADDEVLASYMVILHVVHSQGQRPAVDLTDSLWEVYRAALPYKISQIIVAQAHEDGKRELLDFLGYQVARAVEYKSGNQVRPARIVADSTSGILHLLEDEGMNRAVLPHCLGGDYDYDQFADWIRLRISEEDIMSSAPAIRNHLPTISQAMAVGQRLQLTSYRRKRNRLTLDQEKAQSSGKELIRNRNAVYSRRLYHKRKLELESLQGQCEFWQNKNDGVQKDNELLEGLIAQANNLLDEMGLVPKQQPLVPYWTSLMQDLAPVVMQMPQSPSGPALGLSYPNTAQPLQQFNQQSSPPFLDQTFQMFPNNNFSVG